MKNTDEVEKLQKELRALQARLNNLNGGHLGVPVFQYNKREIQLIATPCAHYKYCSEFNTPSCAACQVRQSVN